MQNQGEIKFQESDTMGNQEPQKSGKRKWGIFWLIILTLLLGGGFLVYKNMPHRDPLLAYIKPDKKISATDFDEFIKHLDENRKLNLLKALSINSKGNQEEDWLNTKKEIIWRASHWMSYPFKKNEVDYHQIVKWTARKMGVSDRMLETYSTFQLERCIVEKVFERSWEKMTPQQREDFLNKIDHKGSISNKAGIAALSGAGALAALSTTAYISGIAFFSTTMSAIAFIGHTVGITLPFIVYTKAAAATAVLTGPVGWGIAAVIGAGGLVLCGQASADKTAQAIIQIHAIKLDAMSKSGINIDQYLPSVGKPQ